ncbi:TIGR04282 family arsenosugar biosynthesis glycosyltransferase [Daejeonella sp.]|jgi:rSAM/selenodomain-associated transferase 1|uniref:TIGR04282 family arsenosugar biosynthesis glycosyltransferase n=1 Tax=Daejeonella sp. TaxID=2805397 RepID=UPI003784F617
MKLLDSVALIVFVRNPIYGKVKTRLAKDIGDDRALEIYKLLLKYTFSISQRLNCKKFVYYADEIVQDDIWNLADFTKRQQEGNDLGERMHQAMNELFIQGFTKVILIGSDCFELNTPVLEEAIFQLDQNDAVLGPATDGGYYLLGLNEIISELFSDKIWSTDQVSQDTINDLERLQKTYYLLPELNDIDDVNDLELFEKSECYKTILNL